jgi:hypothetical protein
MLIPGECVIVDQEPLFVVPLRRRNRSRLSGPDRRVEGAMIVPQGGGSRWED